MFPSVWSFITSLHSAMLNLIYYARLFYSNANTKHSTLSISYVLLFLWTLLWSNYIQSILWCFLTLLCCLFDFLLLVSHFWQGYCQWRWERQSRFSYSTDSWDSKQFGCGVASLEGPGQVRPRAALFLAPSGSWNWLLQKLAESLVTAELLKRLLMTQLCIYDFLCYDLLEPIPSVCCKL